MGTKRRRPRRRRAFDRTIKHQHKHKRTKKMTKLHAVLVGSLLLAGGSGAMAQASDPLAQIERIPNEIIGAVTLNPVVHEAKCPGPECQPTVDVTNCVFRGDCYKYAEGGRRLQDAGEKQVYDALLNVAGDALHNADPATSSMSTSLTWASRGFRLAPPSSSALGAGSWLPAGASSPIWKTTPSPPSTPSPQDYRIPTAERASRRPSPTLPALPPRRVFRRALTRSPMPSEAPLVEVN